MSSAHWVSHPGVSRDFTRWNPCTVGTLWLVLKRLRSDRPALTQLQGPQQQCYWHVGLGHAGFLGDPWARRSSSFLGLHTGARSITPAVWKQTCQQTWPDDAGGQGGGLGAVMPGEPALWEMHLEYLSNPFWFPGISFVGSKYTCYSWLPLPGAVLAIISGEKVGINISEIILSFCKERKSVP